MAGENARTGLLHQPTRATPRWAEWVWRIHGIDPSKCGRCGGPMQVAGLLLPEDGVLFLRWLQALKDHRPELPRSRDGPGVLSQS